jgi:hypothetical protein
VQKDLDIAEYTDPQHNPMIPHTLVLEPGLHIYKNRADHEYRERHPLRQSSVAGHPVT